MKSGIKWEAEYAISTIPRCLSFREFVKSQREDILLRPWNKGTIPDCIDHILKHDVRAHGFSWVRTGFNVLSIDLGLAEIGDMGAKKWNWNWFVKSLFFQDAGVDVELYIFYKSCPAQWWRKLNHQKRGPKCTRVEGGIGCSKSCRLSHHEWRVISDGNELQNAYIL